MKSDKASQDIHYMSQVSRLLFTLKAPMKTNMEEEIHFSFTTSALRTQNIVME